MRLRNPATTQGRQLGPWAGKDSVGPEQKQNSEASERSSAFRTFPFGPIGMSRTRTMSTLDTARRNFTTPSQEAGEWERPGGTAGLFLWPASARSVPPK